ncbi:radical SAM protein [Parabacteroides sp. PF5-9]|uniref:radical SAM protein n=1 Tax=Parabacteroides sp. PF5-9 TaxID=1742404 RepID=UPI002474D757|nr:radical SAM protein [Parabacteroides sp. PF5-9]MDH6358495.1 biotin synthase [Parabacteroides sp. PF5-9]
MNVLAKIRKGDYTLTEGEVIELLKIENLSDDFFELLALSNQLSRKKFGQRGYVFTQIGINAEPCPINCAFCSMGAAHYSMDSQWEKTAGEICSQLAHLQKGYFDDFFLMTTADYPQDKFLSVGKAVRPLLRNDQKLVANIGDFDLEMARQLKEAGFTGVYHINRLREGVDTMADPKAREATLQAVQAAGLELYYCIEPIGPEHTYEEITVEILRARDLEIAVMAAMRRTAVKGTPLYERGQISAVELTKIVAVTNLVVNPSRAMNVHEPIQAALMAGVNQLYAEVGANPRDTDSHTEQSRGFNTEAAWGMLNEFGYGYK